MLRRAMMAGGATPTPVNWNPADKDASIVLSGGNLVATKNTPEAIRSLRATLARDATDSGGFYFEIVCTSGANSPFMQYGVATSSMALNASMNNADGWCIYQEDGTVRHGGVTTAYGATWTTGDVIGVLLKNGKLYFRKNGTWLGSADVDAETGEAFSGMTGSLFPAAALYRSTSPAHVITGRFKASDFSGSIPAGAAAWES